MSAFPSSLPPIIIGEVLYDHFPDGQKILGGAPFNVAWDLQGLGTPCVFVSAVGDDENGLAIRRRMQAWGLDMKGLQINSRSTGRVDVTLDNGQPSYEIVEGVAYDFMERPDFRVTREHYSLCYTGTLALRSEKTRNTIFDLLRSTDLPRFVDVNIRDPWFEVAWLDDLIDEAKWVKMNEIELSRISGLPTESESQITAAAASLADRYRVETFLITCGSRGAYAIESGGVTFAPAPPPKKIADTVGAGDAFAAATIHGIVSGLTLAEVLPKSVAFASRVCELTGATTNDQTFYVYN